MKTPVVSFVILLFFSCSESVKEEGALARNTVSDSLFKSTFFEVEELGHDKRITVVNPLDLQQKEVYYLSSEESGKKAEDKGYYIQTPVEKVVCLSTSHIGYLNSLGVGSSIVGALNPELIYSSELQKKHQSGEIASVGGAVLDMEKLLELNVDLVFANVYDAGGMEKVDQMRRLGVNVVLVSGFLEEKPLEKAEWLRFFAPFFGEQYINRADSIFEEVKRDYLYTASLVNDVSAKPKVITGLPWSGTWYVPGGSSFQSNFISSAAAKYIFAENDNVNSFVVDFEVMMEKGMEVPYWINVSDAETKAEIASLDQRFSYFRAFKEGNIYNNNARKNSAGGNDYWESGVVRPDIVLKDLVKIFHSGILPDYQLYYYQQLED